MEVTFIIIWIHKYCCVEIITNMDVWALVRHGNERQKSHLSGGSSTSIMIY